MTNLFILLTAVALLFYLFPPKNINRFYGYRTSKSMENDENWKKANQIASKIMLLQMICFLFISLLFDWLNYENNIVLLILFFLSIGSLFYFTEKKLKK